MRLKLTHIAAASILALCSTAANASLTLLDPEDYPKGFKPGPGNTILTIQHPGNVSTESGSVGRVAGTNELFITGSQVLDGASQTQTRTFSQLRIGSAADLRVVFDPSEPGGGGRQSIDLKDLTLNAYNDEGVSVFTASLDQANYHFPNTSQGAGNAGFSFGLTAAEVAELEAVFHPLLQVGLSATAGLAHGGPETFYVASPPIPEPETYALMLAGLGLLAFARRKRKAGSDM